MYSSKQYFFIFTNILAAINRRATNNAYRTCGNASNSILKHGALSAPITMMMLKGGKHANIMCNNCKDNGKVEELVRCAYDIKTTWVPLLRKTTCAASAKRTNTNPTNEVE